MSPVRLVEHNPGEVLGTDIFYKESIPCLNIKPKSKGDKTKKRL